MNNSVEINKPVVNLADEIDLNLKTSNLAENPMIRAWVETMRIKVNKEFQQCIVKIQELEKTK